MFEFTKSSRKILEIYAQSEGKRLNSDFLSAEHILLALLSDEDSVAARIMKNLGIDFVYIKKEIESSLRQPGSSIILGKIPHGPAYKRIVELSKDEAKKLKNSYIGTEHLLLAIFRERSFPVLKSLVDAGVDYNVIRSEILRVLGVKIGIDRGTSKSKLNQKRASIDEFTTDLTKLAESDLLDPVIGRSSEISRIIRVLSRKRKNNPILIGEAGVGKTAIVEGLAMLIVQKEVPDSLLGQRVLSLDMASIVAGTKYRGEFEDRLKKIVNEVMEKKNIILFIDELHSIIGAGAAEGAIDAANILKPALARGELQCIGATTINEYRSYIEKDTALVRRFQSIHVDEPDIDETIEILNGLKERYEKHHKVTYLKVSIEKAAYYANRYITGRYLPDTAIDLLDEAGAMARLNNHSKPEDLTVLEEKIEELDKKKNSLVLSQEYEQAAAIRDQIKENKDLLAAKQEDWNEKKNDYEIIVTPEDIALVVEDSTGIPVENIQELESDKLVRMDEELHKRIIGQNEAIDAISRAIRRSRLGINSPNRPNGSFIFLGPTGVGKTELAKALAEFLFEDDSSLVRLDMSEYMEKHSVARLIGAPPGYLGFNDGGQLTEKVKRKPYSIVLFDEIEKAHHDVFNILLQILEEGELTDGMGTTISFRDTIIIITSNIGNREYQKSVKLGFSSAEIQDNNDKVSDELKIIFTPEFLNRIDEVVYFHKLDKGQIKKILDLMLNDLSNRLKTINLDIEISKKVKKYILDKGYDEMFGARNLRRVLQREIEDNLAMELLKQKEKNPGKVAVSIRGKKLFFKFDDFNTQNPNKEDKIEVKSDLEKDESDKETTDIHLKISE